MRVHTKGEPDRLWDTVTDPDRLWDTVTDSLGAVRSGQRRGTLLKAALVAGGVAALTAGSAAISSLRRRMDEVKS
jgi:hypothetical protein